MSQSSVHLLDLPNEILSIILRKLDNVNVLYSLFAVINERFDRLLQNNVSANTLHLVSISSTDDEISSLDEPVLNRFCTNILPRIHPNVTHLTLESMSMERILLAGNYPNLTYLKLFNFGKEIALYYFKGKYSRYSQQIKKRQIHFIQLCFRSINLSTYASTSNNRTCSSK